jgi:hypothetical protein
VHASSSQSSSSRIAGAGVCAELVYDSAKEAQAALDALVEAGLTAVTVYNATPFEDRGWLVAEHVSAHATAAHLSRLKTLPAALRQAEAHRPKLIDITQYDAPRVDTPVATARELFDAAQAKLQSAAFRQDADRKLVQRLLLTLDQVLHNRRSHTASSSDSRHRVELAYEARIKYLTRRFAPQ